MSVKLMSVVPHGVITVKELKYRINTEETINGFKLLNKLFDKHKIEHLFIVDPHDFIIKENFSFYSAQFYEGSLIKNDIKIDKSYNGDEEIHERVDNLKINNLTIVRENMHNIGWGSLVPLHHLNNLNSRTVSLLTIDRKIETNILKETGLSIFNLLNSIKKNIAIIFSCDLSHAHSKTNPKFPYNSNSYTYDKHVFDVLNDRIETYNQISKDIIRQCNTDAHAQLTMLAGICETIRYSSQVLSYEVPTYFGMLTSIVEIK